MTTKTSKLDIAELLKSSEDVAAFPKISIETDSPEEFIESLGAAARSRSMTEVANEAGVGRESLYKSLTAGARPEFRTVAKVMSALGASLTVEASLEAQHLVVGTSKGSVRASYRKV